MLRKIPKTTRISTQSKWPSHQEATQKHAIFTHFTVFVSYQNSQAIKRLFLWNAIRLPVKWGGSWFNLRLWKSTVNIVSTIWYQSIRKKIMPSWRPIVPSHSFSSPCENKSPFTLTLLTPKSKPQLEKCCIFSTMKTKEDIIWLQIMLQFKNVQRLLSRTLRRKLSSKMEALHFKIFSAIENRTNIFSKTDLIKIFSLRSSLTVRPWSNSVTALKSLLLWLAKKATRIKLSTHWPSQLTIRNSSLISVRSSKNLKKSLTVICWG